MGMFHSTSGKAGSAYYCHHKAGEPIPRDDLIRILKREDELRHSRDTQALYSKEFDNGNDYLAYIRDVTIDIQKQALRDCDYEDSAQQLARLHSHRYYYSDDEEILSLSVYGRHDITANAEPGYLLANQPNLDDISVYNLKGREKTLAELLSPNKVTLILAKFGDEVEFLMVYIREAHASDQWPLGDIVSIEQHKSLDERIEAAKMFIEKYNFPMQTVVDSMANQFNKSFLAWPERYYIYKGHNLRFISYPANEFGFDRLKLRFDLSFLCNRDSSELDEAKLPVYSEVPINKNLQKSM